MFNNLIESSSHISELKRRGSFFLFTVVTYAVLFRRRRRGEHLCVRRAPGRSEF